MDGESFCCSEVLCKVVRRLMLRCVVILLNNQNGYFSAQNSYDFCCQQACSLFLQETLSVQIWVKHVRFKMSHFTDCFSVFKVKTIYISCVLRTACYMWCGVYFCLTGYGSADCGKKFNNCSNFASSRSWHSWSAQYTECPYADVLLLFTKGDLSNFCTSSQTWTCLMQWICFNILSPGCIMHKVTLISEYFLCNIFV